MLNVKEGLTGSTSEMDDILKDQANNNKKKKQSENFITSTPVNQKNQERIIND